MAMNVGMLACYDQAKEISAKLLNDPMKNGPQLSTKLLSSAVAVRFLTQLPLLLALIEFR
jgi:solute carrier family 25 (mitochondrial oxoglutarate transporter), member 11